MVDTPAKVNAVPNTPPPQGQISSLSNVPEDVKATSRDGITRTLKFRSQNPGKIIDLLLMFEPPEGAGKLYDDLFPICWKLISFWAAGYTVESVVYTAESGLLVPQVAAGNCVYALDVQPCETGQSCILEMNGEGNAYLTGAVDGKEGYIECFNNTGSYGSVGFGIFESQGTDINPAFIWTSIDRQSTLSFQFTPKLKIYAVDDYMETEIIKGEIGAPLLWSNDLASLGESTSWNVSIDKSTGEVVIEAA